ncbi:MAG: hypothetical protein EKK61_03215 [Rickettsiales bacterium]|nr:MAG: hypothetical protein EKK61_03215 [Rickettsiales bacterium]
MLLITLFIILTTATLFLGLVSMAMGKEFNKKYATKLMSLRVLFQTFAIITLLIAYSYSKN